MDEHHDDTPQSEPSEWFRMAVLHWMNEAGEVEQPERACVERSISSGSNTAAETTTGKSAIAPHAPSSLSTPRDVCQRLPVQVGRLKENAPRPPPLSSFDPAAIVPASSRLSAIGALAPPRTDGVPSRSSANSSNSCASSPSQSVQEGKAASFCNGNRGENPYRRKWNPRKAAAQRREREKHEKLREDHAAQQHQANVKNANIVHDNLYVGEPVEIDVHDAVEERAAARIKATAMAAAPEQLARYKADEAPATLCKAADSNDHHMNSRSGQAGFSLCAPLDRGPEHAPGIRGRNGEIADEIARVQHFNQATTLDRGELKSAGIPQSFGPPSMPDSHSSAWHSMDDLGSKRCPSQQGDVVDFNQLHRMISRGIACAEVGEEPDMEVDELALATMGSTSGVQQRQFRPPNNRQRAPSPRAAAFRTSVAAASASHGAPASSSQEAHAVVPASSVELAQQREQQPKAKRTMAEIRAAAERRAYTPTIADDTPGAELEATAFRTHCTEETGPSDAAPNSNMASIRAMAERRTRLGQGGTMIPTDVRARTPRQFVSHEKSSTPRGGAYKPTHVYSGRSAEGGVGLAETLGLRFGVPPPHHS